MMPVFKAIRWYLVAAFIVVVAQLLRRLPDIHLEQGQTKDSDVPTFRQQEAVTHQTAELLSPSTVRETCFTRNSINWLNGTKESNADTGITPDLLDILMEGPLHGSGLEDVLGETICHSDSPFRRNTTNRDDSKKGDSNKNDRDLLTKTEDWYHRFLYLVLHWKFHQPALVEYKHRKQCMSRDKQDGTDHLLSFMQEQGIGKFDFECPDAKFIVSPVASIGIGGFLNTQGVLTVLLSIKTGRIPIFSVNSFFSWQKGKKGRTQDPWMLAPTDCERKDLQCYFLPTTPCALLKSELLNASIYGSTRGEQKFLQEKMEIPPEIEHERIVVLNSGLMGKVNDSLEIRNVAHSIIGELMDEWKKQQQESGHKVWSAGELEVMESARTWLIDKAEEDPNGLLRQVLVYLLRPNPHYKSLIQRELSALETSDLDPSNTIGIPIRGSDKCDGESTCLPVASYMDLATNVAYPLLSRSRTRAGKQTDPNQRPKLIMTTEDPKFFNDSLPFQHNTSFPFQFLVNDKDNMQNSGFPRDFLGNGEDTIVSSLVALQLHLSARKVYLNCCSNFHAILNNMIQAQCGAHRHPNEFVFGSPNNAGSFASHHSVAAKANMVPSPVSHCLNDVDENIPSRFRICCSWGGDDECKQMHKAYIKARREGNVSIYT